MAEPRGLQSGGGETMRYAPQMDMAELLSRRALGKLFQSGSSYLEYEADLKRMQKDIPPETVAEMQRRSAVSLGNVDAVLNDKTQMAKYSQDAWSRAGLAGLRTLPRYVPLGLGMQKRLLPMDAWAAIQSDTKTGGASRAFFSGDIAQKGHPNLPIVLRHEGNHIVGAKDGADVEHMDSFYGYRTIAPPDFAMLKTILAKAAPYSKKDAESLKYAGPPILQRDRNITPEDIQQAGLTSKEYLQLIDAAHTVYRTTPQHIYRTLPGDTLWGNFIRGIQDAVGEGDITNAMKAWTEVPDQQRKWYRK